MEVVTHNASGKAIALGPTFDQTLVVGVTGSGKTMSIERSIYDHWKNGYQIIILTDQKKKLELAYMQFDKKHIRSKHKELLKQDMIEPESIPVDIYHPLTLNIPHHKIPETHFYSLSIQDLDRQEIALLLESVEAKTTADLIKEAIRTSKPEHNLWDFLEKISTLTQRKQESIGSYEVALPDKESFGLAGTSMGDVRNIDELIRIFKPFRTHPFLTEENSPHKLAWQKLFKNNHIKCFTTRYIHDKKLDTLITLMLINTLIKEKPPTTKILIVMDELKDFCGSDSKEPYIDFVAEFVAQKFNTLFRNNSITSLCGSQSFAGIHPKIIRSNAFTHSIIMFNDSPADLKAFINIYGYGKDEIYKIRNLRTGEAVIRGINMQEADIAMNPPFRSVPAPFPHCEPDMNYDTIYENNFPEHMTNYSELHKEIREYIDTNDTEHYEKTKEKSQKEIATKKEALAKRAEQRETSETRQIIKAAQKTGKPKDNNERINTIIINMVTQMKQGKKITQTDIAKATGISQPSVGTRIKKLREKGEI